MRTVRAITIAVILTTTILGAVTAVAQERQPVTSPPPVAPRLQIPIPGFPSFSQVTYQTEEGTRFLDIPYLAEYFQAIYQFLLGVVATVATVMIVYGGLKWLLAAGAPEKISAAKTIITNAVLGVILALGTYLILFTINPEIVQFRALRIQVVERAPLRADGRADEDIDLPATGANCATPGFRITSIDGVKITSMIEREVRSLAQNRALYERVAREAGIPWEVLAAVHWGEAGGNISRSALNGGAICNISDNPNLLRVCPRCSTPAIENDLFCAAEHLKSKGLRSSPPTLDEIKLAFCGYGGCNRSWRQCPELSWFVAPMFDDLHMDYFKTGLDCVMPGCRDGCVTDATVRPRANPGCCTIKILKPGVTPATDFGGQSLCRENQLGDCKISEDARTATYQYNSRARSRTNPCGAITRQRRPGKLTIYAALKKLIR